jgi:hypothetical protein
MDWLLELRPIRFFSFYLALVFIVSTVLRWQQYQTVLALVMRVRNRCPNLAQLVLSHRSIFLTWGTLRPLILVAALMLINTLAAWFVWPQTNEFSVDDLQTIWLALVVVLISGALMVAFDVWGMVQVEKIDQAATEKYLDQAEYWLRGWQAPVVRIVSLGFVNPRQIVNREVRTALEGVAQMLNATLWWVSVQTALRIAFGLTLWSSYVLWRLLGAD